MSPPFMQLYVADYLADTTHLTRGEHGAYLLLLMAMWRANGRLPADDARLAKLALCTAAEWSEIRDPILAFFKRRGGSLTHKRVSSELAKYADKVEKAKAAGLASALKKANKSKEIQATDVERTHNQPEPEPEPEPEKKDQGANAPLSAGADEPPKRLKAEVSSEDIRQAFDAWNTLARRLCLPTAKDLTDGRRKAIRARLAESGLEAWAEALLAVERSGHCRGENDRNWRADLDFVCQPKSWQRLREGFYGADKAPAAPAPSTGPAEWTESRWRALIELFAESGRWPADIGPKPTEPGCKAPPSVLTAMGYGGASILPFDRRSVA